MTSPSKTRHAIGFYPFSFSFSFMHSTNCPETFPDTKRKEGFIPQQ
jgi:hypothetical protein